MQKSLVFTEPFHCSNDVKRFPVQTLSHPAWWIALVIFVLNDHVFKGSGLLPPVVTGKLSNFTGLFFAPPLFAVLVRVRTRKGLLYTYLFTGFVFSLLNIFPIFSEAIVGFGKWISIEQTSTTDPTDLVTLISLLFSWKLFVPQMYLPSVSFDKLRSTKEKKFDLSSPWLQKNLSNLEKDKKNN